MDFSPLSDWPVAPSMKHRPTTFDPEAEAFLGHFPTFKSELDTLTQEIETVQTLMTTAKEITVTSAAAVPYVSGPHVVDDIVLFEQEFYSCIEDAALNESPSTHPEKWIQVGTTNIVDLDLHGGVDISGDTADVTLAPSMKRIQYRSQDGHGRFYTLPAGSNFKTGAGVVVAYNTGTKTYGYRDTDGNFLCAVAPGQYAVFDLIDNKPGAEIWQVRGDCDRIMAYLETVFTTSAVSHLASGKLSQTETLVAFRMSSKVYAGVIIDTGAIPTFWGTAQNTPLEVTTEAGTGLAVAVNKETATTGEACLCFSGADSHGNAQMLRWTAATKVLEKTGAEFEFSSSAIEINVVSFHASKFFVVYRNLTANELQGEVLDWNGSTLSSLITASKKIAGPLSVTMYPQAGCLTSAVDAATIAMSFRVGASLSSVIVTWSGGTFFLISSAQSILSYPIHPSSLVMLDPDHYVIFGACYQDNSTTPGGIIIKAVLMGVQDGNPVAKRMLDLDFFSTGGVLLNNNTAFKIDPEHIMFLSYSHLEGMIHKIRAVGAPNNNDCILKAVSSVSSPMTASAFNLTGLSDSKAFKIYGSHENNSYLTVKKVEVA